MGVSFSMDPLSAGVGALSSVVGAIQSNNNLKRQLRAQAEENQKTRQYNLMLAQQQNAWNIEQWQRENEYNSPLQQRQRLAAAGMNPDLAYSGGNMSNLAAPSPAMTSGAPSTPMDFSAMQNYKSVGSITTQALQNSLLAAQIDKVKADTNNTNVDTQGKQFQNVIYKADADVAAQLAHGKIQLQNGQIELAYSGAELNVEEKGEIKRKCRALDLSNRNLIKEGQKYDREIRQMDLDYFMKEVEKKYQDGYWQSIIKSNLASAAASNANARTLIETLDASKRIFEGKATYQEKLNAAQDIQNKISAVMLEPPATNFGDVKSYAELVQYLNKQTYSNNRHAKSWAEWFSWRMQNIDDTVTGNGTSSN